MNEFNLLRTLDRALWILTLFTVERPEWGVSKLASELGLPKSVVQKTLATFARRGFLHQDPDTRRYRLGFRFLAMAQSVVLEREVARIAEPYLVSLAEETRETAKISVVDEGESVILAVVESPRSMRMTGRVGERHPLYAGASNKVLAAHMPWSRLWRAIERHADPAHPVRRDPEGFRRELEAIAARGYTVSSGENETGVTAISAPVWGGGEEVVASLSVLGPDIRLPQSHQASLISALLNAATAISRAMGSGGGTERGDA